jgi:hypothetical protein
MSIDQTILPILERNFINPLDKQQLYELFQKMHSAAMQSDVDASDDMDSYAHYDTDLDIRYNTMDTHHPSEMEVDTHHPSEVEADTHPPIGTYVPPPPGMGMCVNKHPPHHPLGPGTPSPHKPLGMGTIPLHPPHGVGTHHHLPPPGLATGTPPPPGLATGGPPPPPPPGMGIGGPPPPPPPPPGMGTLTKHPPSPHTGTPPLTGTTPPSPQPQVAFQNKPQKKWDVPNMDDVICLNRTYSLLRPSLPIEVNCIMCQSPVPPVAITNTPDDPLSYPSYLFDSAKYLNKKILYLEDFSDGINNIKNRTMYDVNVNAPDYVGNAHISKAHIGKIDAKYDTRFHSMLSSVTAISEKNCSISYAANGVEFTPDVCGLFAFYVFRTCDLSMNLPRKFAAGDEPSIIQKRDEKILSYLIASYIGILGMQLFGYNKGYLEGKPFFRSVNPGRNYKADLFKLLDGVRAQDADIIKYTEDNKDLFTGELPFCFIKKKKVVTTKAINKTLGIKLDWLPAGADINTFCDKTGKWLKTLVVAENKSSIYYQNICADIILAFYMNDPKIQPSEKDLTIKQNRLKAYQEESHRMFYSNNIYNDAAQIIYDELKKASPNNKLIIDTYKGIINRELPRPIPNPTIMLERSLAPFIYFVLIVKNNKKRDLADKFIDIVGSDPDIYMYGGADKYYEKYMRYKTKYMNLRYGTNY